MDPTETAKSVQEAAVWQALRRVDDPELGINVVDLGLIYRASVDGVVARIEMTMTTPACPLGPHLTSAVEDALLSGVPGIEQVQVEIVWEPPWHPGLMSPDVGDLFGRR